jgi:microcystin-dependent protein
MTTLLFNNNAVGTLAVSCTSSATTIQLTAGQGALFPTPGAGQAFLLWAQNNTQVEAMLCTNNAGNVLTVTRAQEGTTAQAFAAGTIIEQRVSAAVLNSFAQTAGGVLAQVGGSATQAFLVANSTASTQQAVPRAQADTLYQAILGNGQAAQAGDIKYTACAAAPAGWLAANGAAVSRTTYATLFAAIGTTYGAGDGSTTFNLPDGRGVFVRGLDSSRGLDPGRVLGTYQADSYAAHTHANSLYDPGHTHGVYDPGHLHSIQYGVVVTTPGFGLGSSGLSYGSIATGTGYTGIANYAATTGITLTNASSGGSETRGKNIAFLCCVKT